MIGSDDRRRRKKERQLVRGRPSSTNQVSRQVPKSDIEPGSPYAPGPICGLPADVLRSIFELYCRVELSVNFPLRFSPPTQVIASQVCSAWRQIMLGSPEFWNKIKVTFHEDDRRYDQYKMVEVPRIWLSRAKDLPCFIDLLGFRFMGSSLMLSHHQPLWQHDINKNIVRDLIAPHNCKNLKVMFADYHLHDLLDLSDEKLSYIEVLRLCYVNDANNRETVSLDFHRLTNLTSFSLDANLLLRPGLVPRKVDQYFQIFSRIPWHQLRHIHLDIYLPVHRCLTILETSSSVLETCSLVVSEDLSIATSPLSEMTPIHCQQLREFKVYIDPKIALDAGDSFLLLLRLPKLKSLTLEYPTWDWDQASIDLQTLFRMWSVCTMRPEKVIISGLTCKVDAGALLASMPSMRCLELPKHTIFTVDAIRKLGAGSIGPLLEELTIKSEFTYEIGELIQMVKSRSSTKKEKSATKFKPTPFKSVHLYCYDHDGSLQQEYDASIDEINELRYILRVKFLDAEEDVDEW
ncbi:hypothetical protein M378DRAFT_386670 [Amanita muscaria Koide BX008]|uniref:F-box domain-containing protein n=1 Tax=Amanita muscaria (strain Koide BX008) TaxID=946122 RepID=A0A0C2WX39_AMAMK|nr:hypothetical protein M378DRAFT_386670 [Amanita muscaria Koide BX008]